MMLKKIFLSIIFSLITTTGAQASTHFQPFNIADYDTRELSRQELVEQIQTFIVRTLPKIDNCHERGEGEFQDVFCTNIYEADRIRLAYLLGYNAHLKPEAVTPNNKIRKLIFAKRHQGITESDIASAENPTFSSITQSDLDGEIPNPHKIKKKPYYSHLDANFKFGMATETALRSCALEGGGYSHFRLRTLNPQLNIPKDPNEQLTEHYYLIGCQDLKLVMRQFLSQSNINHILNHSPNLRWLNFNQSEKINLQLTQAEINRANDTILSDSEYQDAKSKCAMTGLQALLICPPMRAAGGFTQAGLNIIQKSMVLNPKFTNNRTKGGRVLYLSWIEFRNISNLILIIAFMLMITAYIANRQLDVYNLRKILPKFAVITILINASFLIMQVAVDISNLVGISMFNLISDTMPFDYDIMKTVSTVLAGGLVLGTVAVAPFITIAILIPVILSSVLSVLAMVVLLAFRDSAFIIILVLTPIALISLMFPQSDRFYQVWKKALWTILFIPPLIGIMFGSGKFLSGLLFQIGGLMQIFYIIPLGLQFYLIPKILINSIKNLPLIGNQVASTLAQVPDAVTNKYKSSEFHRQSISNFKAQRNRSILRAKFDKQHPYSSTAYLAANKLYHGKNQVIDRFVPGYKILTQAPDFDREAFQEMLDSANKLDPVVAKYYLMEKGIINVADRNKFEADKAKLPEQTRTQLQTMTNNNNPDQILSSLIKTSDDGEGDAQAVLNGFKQYLEQGGDYANINHILQITENNYKKEAKFTDAAQLKKVRDAAKTSKIDYQAASNHLQSLSDTDKINDTSSYFSTVTNWSKFKGFKDHSIEDKAFQQFITSPSGKAQLSKIKSQVSQNSQAVNYLSRF